MSTKISQNTTELLELLGEVNNLPTGGGSARATVIHLPEQYDIVEGDTLELFYSGIVNVGNIQNFIIECSCPVGEAYGRKYTFTPAADNVGKEYNFAMTVKDVYGNVVDTAQTTIAVHGVGDSVDSVILSGNMGAYVAPSGSVMNGVADFYVYDPIHLDGSMKTLRLKNVIVNPYVAKVAFFNSPTFAPGDFCTKVVTLEGNDGDVVSADIEIDTTYQYMYIATNCDSSGVIEDTDEEYYILSGGSNSKTGNVLCVGDSLTADGTWVKEFQSRLMADGFDEVALVGSQIADTAKHEGRAGWGYGSFLAESESNPFWNPATSAIDFANYMAGLGLPGQTIDCCVILLGWNESGVQEEQFKNNINAFCSALRSTYPNCQIMFVGLQIPSIDGLGANYGTTWHWKEKCDFVHNLDRWYRDIASSMEGVKVVQLCGQFDAEYNMPAAARQVNKRNPAQETCGTNGVHPNEYGYLQIADAVYRGFIGF